MQYHSLSFFGQKTGLIVNSADWSEAYMYLRFIKKKANNSWEKPSNKEGKVIKINILELISIIKTLTKGSGKWSTVHRFGNESTPISLECAPNTVNISIPGYQKYMKFPETVLLLDLLKHIYEEKITNATGSSLNSAKTTNRTKSTPNVSKSSSNSFSKNNAVAQSDDYSTDENEPDTGYSNPFEKETATQSQSSQNNARGSQIKSSQDPNSWVSCLQLDEEFYLVPGEVMAKRDKAWAFQVLDHSQIWVPRSQLKEDDGSGGLWIKQWFIDKKLDDIFAPQTA
jgi:hypothetical protein